MRNPVTWRRSSLVVPVLLLASVLVAAATRGPTTVWRPFDCDVEAAQDLSAGSWVGDVDTGDPKCLYLSMTPGEFARLSIVADSGMCQATVGLPGDTMPLLRVQIWGGEQNAQTLAWEATEPGLYQVVLQAEVGGILSRARGVGISMEEYQSADLRRAEREKLATDPRVRWLADNAIAVRSISPADTDYSDLGPLADALAGVRVVLLGEAHHGDGSDFLAKGRLIRFLHEEMGFDVLAFESSLFGVARAWQAVRSGAPPHAALLDGISSIWVDSEQVQPLIAYVAGSLHTDHPMELAGFDPQFGGSAAKEHLVSDLRAFLAANALAGLHAELEGTNEGLLQDVVDSRFYSDPASLPDSAGQADFVRFLGETAREIEAAVDSREARSWSQTLRSTSVQARILFDAVAGRGYDESRDRQMAENLVWLANEYFPGRKIIAWAHTGHVMRSPTILEPYPLPDYLMGDGVWEAFGEESYVVGFSSYEGSYRWITSPTLPDWSIVPDQRPGAELEELMAAAGHDLAILDLRAARKSGSWLGGSFVARPLLLSWTSRWSESLDALFFIRTQEPSRRVEAPGP